MLWIIGSDVSIGGDGATFLGAGVSWITKSQLGAARGVRWVTGHTGYRNRMSSGAILYLAEIGEDHSAVGQGRRGLRAITGGWLLEILTFGRLGYSLLREAFSIAVTDIFDSALPIDDYSRACAGSVASLSLEALTKAVGKGEPLGGVKVGDGKVAIRFAANEALVACG